MKKWAKIAVISVLIIIIASAILFAREYLHATSSATPEPVDLTPSIPSSSTPSDTDFPADAISFTGEFISAGIWPDISGIQVDTGILVLNRNNIDSSDHLFLDQKFLINLWNEILPGNTLYFSGRVQRLEWAAGSHYYQVIWIQEFRKTADASQEEIEKLIENYGYCSTDEDCTTFYAECPFGCTKAVNTKFLDISQQLISNHNELSIARWEPICVYGCVAIQGVKCENYKCKAIMEI